MTDPIAAESLSPVSWRLAGMAAARTPLARGSAWIVASTVLGALGGGLFWLVAARGSPANEVGLATALFSSVAFVNYVTGLGLPVSVARFGGSETAEAGVFFSWAVLTTVVSSAVVTVVYLPFIGKRSDVLFGWGVPPGVAFFAMAAAGTAVGQLVDMRLTVQRRWSWVTIRIAAYSLLRFPLLLLIGESSAFALFALAAGLPALAGFVGWWLSMPGEQRFRLRPIPSTARAAVRYSAVNYLSQLAVQAPILVLPVFVLLGVSARDNAAFFIAWSIAITTFLLPVNVVKVLLAEGSKGGELRRHVRITLAANAGIGLVASVGAAAGADLVTTIYGESYAGAADLLPLLVAAVLPWGITLVALTHARIVDDEPATFVLSALFAASVLAPAFVLVQSSGAMGAARGWFAGNCVTAVVCGVWLVHRLRVDDHEGVGAEASGSAVT